MEIFLEASHVLLTSVFVIGIAWGLHTYRRHVIRRSRRSRFSWKERSISRDSSLLPKERL